VKVGILCENYYPTLGGEQEHIFHLRRHLETPPPGSEPVEVRIIAPLPAYDVWHGPRDDDHVLRPARSIRVHGLGSASEATLTPRAYLALRRLFASERFDLLHIHAPCDIGLPLWALWAYDGPVVGTLHSYFSHGPARVLAAPIYRYVMARLTRVIAVSEAARDTIARYTKFECEVIGNGVDCEAFAAGRPLPRFADGMTNILSVGRLEPRNGIDLVIEAFATVARDRADLRLILAGDGPYRAQYEAQVARLPAAIGGRVVFLGAVWEERADLYASAHCFALGARKASFPVLLLEALAAGLPVAALPAEGPRSWSDTPWMLAEIAASQTGAAFAEALERALAPAAPAAIERARAMARRYDWSEIVPRIRGVYDEAIAAHRLIAAGRHRRQPAAA
jgi:phosphatidylinositol alpha-mannosyltransferase